MLFWQQSMMKFNSLLLLNKENPSRLSTCLTKFSNKPEGLQKNLVNSAPTPHTSCLFMMTYITVRLWPAFLGLRVCQPSSNNSRSSSSCDWDFRGKHAQCNSLPTHHHALHTHTMYARDSLKGPFHCLIVRRRLRDRAAFQHSLSFFYTF